MSRICFYFESYYVGGLDTFVNQLINNWSKEDKITLLCNCSHSGANLFDKNITNENCNIEIHHMPMIFDCVSFFKKKCKSKILHKILMLFSFVFLIPYYIFFSYKVLKMSRFDKLISINGGYPACVSSRCVGISWYFWSGKKAIHNFHNIALKSNKVTWLFDEIIDWLLIKSTAYFISVSRISAESIRIRSAFKNLTNILYIYNGISKDVMKPTFDLRKDLKIEKDFKIFLMLATYEERKGHKYIIDVFNEVQQKSPHIHLVFCGYGSKEDMNKPIQYAKSMGLTDKISFLGYKANAMEYLIQSDILLIGSQQFESFGLTAIEAMKYKKVVLSTNTGGLKEVIKDGEGGYLFDTADVNGMAEKALYLLDNKNREVLMEQGEAGYRRFASCFDVKRMAEQYKTYLDGIA